MNMVTVTSQGQITIPAKIRKAWGIDKSTKLKVSFDENSRRMTVEKPMGLDELRQMARKLTAEIPEGVKSLEGSKIHEFYAESRAREIAEKLRESDQ